MDSFLLDQLERELDDCTNDDDDSVDTSDLTDTTCITRINIDYFDPLRISHIIEADALNLATELVTPDDEEWLAFMKSAANDTDLFEDYKSTDISMDKIIIPMKEIRNCSLTDIKITDDEVRLRREPSLLVTIFPEVVEAMDSMIEAISFRFEMFCPFESLNSKLPNAANIHDNSVVLPQIFSDGGFDSNDSQLGGINDIEGHMDIDIENIPLTNFSQYKIKEVSPINVREPPSIAVIPLEEEKVSDEIEEDRRRREVRRERRLRLEQEAYERKLRRDAAAVRVQSYYRRFRCCRRYRYIRQWSSYFCQLLFDEIVIEKTLDVYNCHVKECALLAEEEARNCRLREERRIQEEIAEETRLFEEAQRAEADRQLLIERQRLAVSDSLRISWASTIKTKCEQFINFEFSMEGIDIAKQLLVVTSPETLQTTKPPSSRLIGSFLSWQSCFRQPIVQSLSVTRNVSLKKPIQCVSSLTPDELDLVDRYSQGRDSSAVQALDLSVEGFQSVKFLSAFTSMRTLNVNVNNLRHTNDLSGLHSLEELRMRDNQISDISSLSNLEELQHLQLDVNNIEDLPVIENLTKLVTFSACSNQISQLPNFPPKLEKIELFQNNIPHVCFESFQHLSSLMHLDLGRNQIEKIEDDVFSSCQLLTHLVLSQNKLTALPVLRLPFLRTLWLSGNQISTFSAWGADSAIFLPMLEKLFLQGNRIQCVELEILDRCLPLLSELDLSFNSIPGTLDAIAGIRHSNLRLLYVQDNPLFAAPLSSAVNSSPPLPTAALHEYLLTICPRLSSLNGNDVVRPIISPAIYSKHHNFSIDHESGALVHLFLSLVFEQNICKQRERQKNKTKLSSSIDNLKDTLAVASGGILLHVLRSQLELLQNLTDISRERLILSEECVPDASLVTMTQCTVQHEDLTDHIGLSSNSTDSPSPLISEAPSPRTTADVSVNSEDDSRAVTAVVHIARMYRGYYARKRLRQALESVRYQDTDLDMLMSEGLDFLAGMDAPAELEDHWLDYSKNEHFAYGDHRRKKYSLSTERSSSAPVASASSSPENVLVTADAGPSVTACAVSRPSSAGTVEGTLMSVSSEARSEASSDVLRGFTHQNIEEWGVSDPTLRATLMRRNKRMVHLQAAQKNREREKDPEYRYQKFMRSANSQTYAPNTSNEVGRLGGMAGRGGRGGRGGTRRAVPLPAWMVGSQQLQQEEDVA